MNKLITNENKNEKRVITFTVNRELREQLKETLMASDRYSLKMKSDWINEAIVMLQENPNYKEMVLSAEGGTKDFVLDKVNMNFLQRCLFSQMRNDVVVAHPDIRGPQAAIIRAAIVGRLLRGL